jgi:hypothetical protein
MSDLEFTIGDTAPSVFGVLAFADGTPIDLTDATVRFQMRLIVERRFLVDAVATIVTADAGEVRYDWETGDLDTDGEYVSRWQITYDDGRQQRTIPANTITVEVP